MTNYECDLSPECYQFAEDHLGETIDVREQSLIDIRKWLNDNPKINANKDVYVLLYFLRATKFRLEKTKKKIKKFYQMRAERLEWYADRNPFAQSVIELLDIGVFLPLKVRDSENRLVVVIRVAAHDPKKHTQDMVLKVGKMVLDLALHLDETTSIYGLVAIFDMKNVSLQHALQLPPPLIKRLVESWACYPCLVKKLEFINAPSYVNVVLNTFRLFMTAKLKSRLSVTKGTSSVDVNLPVELGGTECNYNELAVYWKKLVQNHESWYKSVEQYKSIL